MKKQKQLILFLFLLGLFTSCNKEKNNCWQIATNGYIESDAICNKSKQELQDQFGPTYLVFNASEKRYCWKINYTSSGTVGYRKDLPQSVIDRFYNVNGNTVAKVDCSSFCQWQIQIKRQSKITGNFGPIQLRTDLYDGALADTCTKLFEGRVVVVKETTDSIITAFYQKRVD